MPSTPSQRPWYAYATTSAQAVSPSAPSSSSKSKPRSSLRRTSAYNDFDEQSWLSSLTSSIKTALKRPRERERQHADSVDSPSMRSEPRKRRDRIVVVDEGVQTEAIEDDAAPSGKEAPLLFDVNRARGSPHPPPQAAAGGELAATELLALAGYADEGANGSGAEQGNVLDLQGVLSARQREEQQDDDGVPHIRPAAAPSAAPAMANASSSTSASDLFRQGVDIEDILRQRAAALLQQAGEEEDDDDDDDELDDEEEEEKDEDADMDTPPPRAGGLIQEIPGPDDDASGDASDEEEEEEDEDDEDSSEEEDDSEDDRDDELPIEPVRDQHIRATSNTAASDDVIEIGSSSEEEEEESDQQEDDDEEEEDEVEEEEEDEALQDKRDADLRSDDEEQDDASSPLYDPAVPLVPGPHPDLPPFDPLLAISLGRYGEQEDEEEEEDDDGEEEADGWDEEAAQTFIPRQHLDVEDVDRPDVSIDEAETSSIEEGREEYEPEEDSSKQPNLEAMPIVGAAVAAEQANEFAPPVPPPATSFISASELLPLRNVQDKPASSVASVASAGSAGRREGEHATEAAPAPIEAIPTSAKELVDLKAQVVQPLASGPPSVAATEGSEGAAKEEEIAQEMSTPPLPPSLPNTTAWPSAAAGSFSTSTPTPVGTPSLPAAAIIPPPLATPTKEHAPPPAQPQDGDALRELKSRTREIAREMGAPPSVGATVDSTEEVGKGEVARREMEDEEAEEDDERLATPPLASAAVDARGEPEQVESADAVAEEAAQEPLEAATAEDADAGAEDFDADGRSVDVDIESTGSVLEEPEEGEPRAEADNFDAGNGSVDVEIESTGSVLEEPEEGEPRTQPDALNEEEVEEAEDLEAAAQPPIVAMDMDDLIDLPDDNEHGAEDNEAAVEEEEPKTKDDSFEDEAAKLDEGEEETADAQDDTAAARRPTGSPQGTQFSPRRRRGEPSSSQTEEPASPVPTSIRGMRKHLRSLAARQASEDAAAATTLDTSATAPTGDSTMDVADPTGDSSFVPDSAGPSTTDSRPSRSGRRRFRHRHVHGSHAHAVDEPVHPDHEPDDSQEEHQEEEERHLPTTRSHCGFEKLALTVGDAEGKQRDMFLIVPQCSIRHDRLEQERARALGRATKSENERKVEVESGLLDDEVYHRLARLIGHEMMEEAWLLEHEQEKEEADTSNQAVSPATAKSKGHRRHRSSGGGDRDWLPPDEERHKKHGDKSEEHPGLDADLSLDVLEEEKEQEQEEAEPAQTTETPIMPRRTPSRSAKQASIEPSSTSKVIKRRRSVAQGAEEKAADDAAEATTAAVSSSSKRRRSASVKVEAPPAEDEEEDGDMSVGPSTRSMRRKEAEATEKSPEPMLTRSRSVQRK